MSTANGVELDELFRLTNPFQSVDLDDQIIGEVLVYVFTNQSQNAGYIIAHYELEFIEPLATVHSSIVPLPNGSIGYGVWQDTVANTAQNEMILGYLSGVNVTSPAQLTTGTIYKFMISVDESVFPAGITASTALGVVTSGA
jgi:hypothetical protein